MKDLYNNSTLQIGDTFKVTGDGMNNTSVGGYDCSKTKIYTVKALHNEGKYHANNLYCGTIETKCGKFIWNEGKSLKLITKPQQEDLTGRYIKVLKSDLGGCGYKIGDYLLIKDNRGNCYNVEKVGTLLFHGNKNRFETGHIELMPVDFNPNQIQYEIY